MGSLFIAIQIALLIFTPLQAPADRHQELVPDLLASAVKSSRLGLPGQAPFHLKAVVKDPAHKDPAFEATIEEFWVSPEKWRRTIRSQDFSLDIIVNGQVVSEQSQGGYYPFWLRNAVTAVFDLVPDNFTAAPKTLDTKSLTLAADQNINRVDINGIARTTAATACTGWNEDGGPPPNPDGVSTTLCFNHLRLLNSIQSPYFTSHYMEPGEFEGQQVARKVKIYLKASQSIEVTVNELSRLRNVDDSMFAIARPTPERERFYSLRLRKIDALNLLLNPPEIPWKPVRDGKTDGVLSLIAYIDSQGQVRETRALYSDNEFATAQAESAVKAWHFKPLLRDGVPVQMETLLTFNFSTTSENAVPILSDAEARKQASMKSDPVFTKTKRTKGTEFKVRAYVNEQGKITKIENAFGIDVDLFEAAKSSLNYWQFKPYKVKGKPAPFDADIVFRVKLK
jgi:hypothetical protein